MSEPQFNKIPLFPDELWDGTTGSYPDRNIDSAGDPLLNNRKISEIVALEAVLHSYLALLDLLKSVGSANSILGVDAAGIALEYKSLIEGAGVTINHGAEAITISASVDNYHTAEADAQIKIGYPIYLAADGHVNPAQANSANAAQVAGFSITDTAITFACKYITEGRVVRADWTDIVGAVLLTPGATYFLDAATAGQITTIAPTTGGQYVVRVGRAINTITLDIEIELPIRL